MAPLEGIFMSVAHKSHTSPSFHPCSFKGCGRKSSLLLALWVSGSNDHCLSCLFGPHTEMMDLPVSPSNLPCPYKGQQSRMKKPPGMHCQVPRQTRGQQTPWELTLYLIPQYQQKGWLAPTSTKRDQDIAISDPAKQKEQYLAAVNETWVWSLTHWPLYRLLLPLISVLISN